MKGVSSRKGGLCNANQKLGMKLGKKKPTQSWFRVWKHLTGVCLSSKTFTLTPSSSRTLTPSQISTSKLCKSVFCFLAIWCVFVSFKVPSIRFFSFELKHLHCLFRSTCCMSALFAPALPSPPCVLVFACLLHVRLVSSSLTCVLAFTYVPTSTYLFLSTSFAPPPPSSPCMLASTFLLHVHFVRTYFSIATLCDSFCPCAYFHMFVACPPCLHLLHHHCHLCLLSPANKLSVSFSHAPPSSPCVLAPICFPTSTSFHHCQ